MIASALACRRSHSGRYKSEWYHANASALVGNSSTTKRSCSQAPSSASTLLPRKWYLPPNAATVAGASVTYRRIASAWRICTRETTPAKSRVGSGLSFSREERSSDPCGALGTVGPTSRSPSSQLSRSPLARNGGGAALALDELAAVRGSFVAPRRTAIFPCRSVAHLARTCAPTLVQRHTSRAHVRACRGAPSRSVCARALMPWCNDTPRVRTCHPGSGQAFLFARLLIRTLPRL